MAVREGERPRWSSPDAAEFDNEFHDMTGMLFYLCCDAFVVLIFLPFYDVYSSRLDNNTKFNEVPWKSFEKFR